MNSQKRFGRPSITAVLGLSAIAFILRTSPAAALQADYGVGYSAVLSDNITRTPDGESDWINIGRGIFSLRELSDELDARLFSQLELRHYMSSTFDDDLLLALDGAATWTIAPRRLSLTVEDVYTQVAIDPRGIMTPSNQQEANVFSIGPNFFADFSPVDRLEAGARAGYLYYEASADSSRYSGFARLLHALSPITTVSLNYEPMQVDYRNDSLSSSDYTRHDGYLGLRTTLFGLGLSVDGGQTLIEREGREDVDGTLARVALTRRMNSTNSMDLAASRTFSDAGTDLLNINPAVEGPFPAPISPFEFAESGIYRGDNLDWTFRHQRLYEDDRLHVFWRELEYDTAPFLSRRLQGGLIDVGYDYSATLTGSVFADYAKIEYLNAPRTDEDTGFGARAIYRIRRALFMTAEGRWSERDSTLGSQNYDELRAIFTIMYQTNPAGAADNPFLNYINPLYR